jgi:hypothetical protein
MTLSTPEIETREIEAVDLEEMLNPFQDDSGDDPNRKAHYCAPGDNIEFQHKYGRVENSTELVNNARFHQAEIVALCGHKFTPKHKPGNYDVCSPCAKIAGDILMGG